MVMGWVFGCSFCMGVLFRVRGDILDDVAVALNGKIEAPTAVHARLPAIARFVVLLRVQGRVVKIPF